MTLRTRLTIAFLVVVLGPVLLSAVFVGNTASRVNEERATHQLELAAGAVQTSVAALCQQLRTTAEAVARHPGDQGEYAQDLLARRQASAVVVRDLDGTQTLRSGEAPRPWAECGAPDATVTHDYGAIVARIAVRDTDGQPAGNAWAARQIDDALLRRLTGAAGVQVQPLSRVDSQLRVDAGNVHDHANGQWLRVLRPADGQPVPLALTTPQARAQELHTLLFAVVAVAGLIAVGAAWWLARSATRPLADLAEAADRAANGDLAVRVPVRSGDEAGRVALAFNRMVHRTNTYVQALTASRDQLRGHLSVLGDTLSSTHDLDRILRVILQTAVATTGARAGAVMLLDDNGETLSGQHAEPVAGQDEVPTVAVTVPVVGSLLGSVVATGQARRGRVGQEQLGLHADEPVCGTYVAVPITAPGGRAGQAPPWPTPPGVSGVLALYDRVGGDGFDSTDLVTLRTFASQAAVAVDNVRTHEEAQRLSLTDPLTGLWNYRYLKTALRREVERASRFGHPLTVLAMDLDRFKGVNDVHGHPAGDAVLAEFARRIRSEIREVDLAFRQGGEEFVVLLPETDARGGSTVAQRLGAAVRERPIVITLRGGSEELPIAVTVSIGVAVYPEHGLTPTAVLDAADDALYAAKAAGRDTYRLATAAPDPDTAAEMTVRGGASTPAGDLPRAGGGESDRELLRAGGGEPDRELPRTGGDAGQVTGGAQPPRQTRGR